MSILLPPKPENFSSEEKEQLKKILSKRFFLKGGFYFFISTAFAAMIIYLNMFSDVGDSFAENLGIYNVIFIMLAAFSLRMFAGEIISYYKEINSPYKKVFFTHVKNIRKGKIILGNNLISRKDILLSAPDFKTLRQGDEVCVELSAKTGSLLRVKKISEIKIQDIGTKINNIIR